MNSFTKAVLSIGILLVIYGYVCRMASLYLFWESKDIGWALLFIGVISLLVARIKRRRANGKKSILEKIGIGIMAFVLLVQAILLVLIPNSAAYTAAKQYLQYNPGIENEIGKVVGFSIIPQGAIQVSRSEGTESGRATIKLIVKGTKGFRDVTLNLIKDDQTDWPVVHTELQ